MTELLTSEEAAERIHVSTKTLRQLRRNGHIRYVAVTDRKIRYRPEDCDEYLESRARKAPGCPSTRGRVLRTGTSTSSGKVVGFTARRDARGSARH
ncbi:helix-turn-helix domain-containing protein [Sphingomonas sp. ACRSK]|uniref:helix-turn-helix domain-containing protein n=1 Tax=Sphingomonas sp. ACRSK TaxID=2918213 RepID=UPI00406D0496